MRPKVLVSSLVLAAGVLALAATVALGGDRSRMRAVATGFEEVPSVSSMGRAEFRATIDDDTSTINYTLTFSGTYNGARQVAHIHLGQRTANGGVAAFLCGGGGKPPCNNGSVLGTIGPADVVGPAGQGIAAEEWAELVAAMRAGVTYVNVHTSTQPNGEIRGQINDRNDRERGD